MTLDHNIERFEIKKVKQRCLQKRAGSSCKQKLEVGTLMELREAVKKL